MRRCAEDREDFTEADGTVWPMYVNQGGELYGFCPAKATWDPRLSEVFRLLMIAAETGVMLVEGGILEQPEWWIDTLGWFLPRYHGVKFQARVKSVLGDSGSKMKGELGPAMVGASQPGKGAPRGRHNG